MKFSSSGMLRSENWQLTTFRPELSVSSSRYFTLLKMVPIVCPETSVNANPRCVTFQNRERTHLCRGGSLKLLMKPSVLHTVMRRITTFRSTTDRIYDGGPIILYYIIYYIILYYIILYYIILYYIILHHYVTLPYGIEYSNMLYRFVA